MNKVDPTKAVIYCRVSSDRQVREGDGLNSQETRCRDFADKKGIPVVKVFKDAGVSGARKAAERPAIKNLLEFLDIYKEPVFIIVDDLSRLARDTEVGLALLAQLKMRGAVLISPTQRFDDTPAGKMVTTMLMATSAFHRDLNIEQVCNRQKARLQNGYWVFGRPLGYRFTKDTVGGGKIMMRDEPKATLIAEALDGFASGRFEAQADVGHFLSRSGVFGKNGIYGSRIRTLLTNILYTGYIEFPAWGVSLRQGRHPALISMQTYERILERLGLKARAPYRKDLNEDFPLRGFILCAECQQPLTGAFSTSRSKKKHPYYRCKNTACHCYGKGLRREQVESDFVDTLSKMAPSEPVIRLLEAITKDCWQKKRHEHDRRLTDLERAKTEAEQTVTQITARLVKTTDEKLIEIYENQVKEHENRRQMLAAQAAQADQIDTSYERALGTVLDFVGNPLSMWENGDLDDKRLVLKLAFAKPITYDKETGLGTAVTSLPFTVFQGCAGQKGKMVVEVGFEPTNS